MTPTEWLETLYDHIAATVPLTYRDDAYAAALGQPRCGHTIHTPTQTYTCILGHDVAIEHVAADGTTWHTTWTSGPPHTVVHQAHGPTLTLPATEDLFL